MINFIKRFFAYIVGLMCVLFFMIFSKVVAEEVVAYKFYWFSIPVAVFTLKYDELERNVRNFEFSISTQGPLGWVWLHERAVPL